MIAMATTASEKKITRSAPPTVGSVEAGAAPAGGVVSASTIARVNHIGGSRRATPRVRRHQTCPDMPRRDGQARWARYVVDTPDRREDSPNGTG
ncbi:hypothetical protein GCM10023322_44810 [Rugosimonospora acidiphila]|uniref:Uncharacterized protein n=1 Tax=Rugosimonospora acidiphila TaxID=556531 RepID=A0ABP9S3V2_9ACTN